MQEHLWRIETDFEVVPTDWEALGARIVESAELLTDAAMGAIPADDPSMPVSVHESESERRSWTALSQSGD